MYLNKLFLCQFDLECKHSNNLLRGLHKKIRICYTVWPI